MKAFYFATKERKLRYNDNRKIVVGETHSVSGRITLCENGLHASTSLLDALAYAPGSVLYLVELSGEMDVGVDKVAAQSRKYLAEFDCEELLRKFARKQALINISKVKPYCTEKEYSCILNYLKTGNKLLRPAAELVARSAGAAASAAELVTRAVAESAADPAIWAVGAAVNAANSAVNAAAGAAEPAVEIASGAVKSAAWAAGVAAGAAEPGAYAARSEARSEAWAAAWAAAEKQLIEMFRKETGWEI